MKLVAGESIGEYVTRLEQRVKELEPPEGFTTQEWHVGQVYTYLLWRQAGDDMHKWHNMLQAYEARFPEHTKKFADYMGWNKDKKD